MNKKLLYFLIVLAMAGWGMSWINAKVLSNYVDEYQLMFIRGIFTIISFGTFLIVQKKIFTISFKNFLLAFLNAIIMLAYMKYYFLGTKFGTASLGGALVSSLIPINTFLLMAIFFGKKITKKIFFALLLGIFGVLVTLNIWKFSYQQIFTIYNQYFLLASLLWAILSIVSGKVNDTPILVFIFYVYLMTTLLVMFFFIDIQELKYIQYDGIFWLHILTLSIFATTFSTIIYFIGIRKLGTSEINSFMFLVPVFAILFGAFCLKEKINFSTIIGTTITIVAVKIINSKQNL